MIEAKLIPNNSAYLQQSHPHFTKLSKHQRIGIKDNTSCFNTCFPCICKHKYDLTTVEKGYYLRDPIYNVNEECCLCCSTFKVRNAGGEEVLGDWKQRNQFFCFNFCGGPKMNVTDSEDRFLGQAFKPCQLCNYGIDVNDPSENLEFYIGSNETCCGMLCAGCSILCFCCKCGGTCCKCGEQIYRYPIWNAERTMEVGNLYHVVTCMRVMVPCLPCFGSKHSVIELPVGTDELQKLRISAGSLLFDRTVIPTSTNRFSN